MRLQHLQRLPYTQSEELNLDKALQVYRRTSERGTGLGDGSYMRLKGRWAGRDEIGPQGFKLGPWTLPPAAWRREKT